jgi:hypothetical protein
VSNAQGHFSKSTSLSTYCAKRMTEIALNTIKMFNKSVDTHSEAW